MSNCSSRGSGSHTHGGSARSCSTPRSRWTSATTPRSSARSSPSGPAGGFREWVDGRPGPGAGDRRRRVPGHGIVRLLRERGLAVCSLSRKHHPHLQELGVDQVQGDVADSNVVRHAVEGCGTVFHTAAKAGLWGPVPEYRRANVQGTRNVVDACRSAGVPRLIYTSSPSVVFNGSDLAGTDSRAVFEPVRGRLSRDQGHRRAARPRGNSDKLATISIRPHLIWGPGDNNLLPRIIARARTDGSAASVGQTR